MMAPRLRIVLREDSEVLCRVRDTTPTTTRTDFTTSPTRELEDDACTATTTTSQGRSHLHWGASAGRGVSLGVYDVMMGHGLGVPDLREMFPHSAADTEEDLAQDLYSRHEAFYIHGAPLDYVVGTPMSCVVDIDCVTASGGGGDTTIPWLTSDNTMVTPPTCLDADTFTPGKSLEDEDTLLLSPRLSSEDANTPKSPLLHNTSSPQSFAELPFLETALTSPHPPPVGNILPPQPSTEPCMEETPTTLPSSEEALPFHPSVYLYDTPKPHPLNDDMSTHNPPSQQCPVDIIDIHPSILNDLRLSAYFSEASSEELHQNPNLVSPQMSHTCSPSETSDFDVRTEVLDAQSKTIDSEPIYITVETCSLDISEEMLKSKKQNFESNKEQLSMSPVLHNVSTSATTTGGSTHIQYSIHPLQNQVSDETSTRGLISNGNSKKDAEVGQPIEQSPSTHPPPATPHEVPTSLSVHGGVLLVDIITIQTDNQTLGSSTEENSATVKIDTHESAIQSYNPADDTPYSVFQSRGLDLVKDAQKSCEPVTRSDTQKSVDDAKYSMKIDDHQPKHETHKHETYGSSITVPHQSPASSVLPTSLDPVSICTESEQWDDSLPFMAADLSPELTIRRRSLRNAHLNINFAPNKKTSKWKKKAQSHNKLVMILKQMVEQQRTRLVESKKTRRLQSGYVPLVRCDIIATSIHHKSIPPKANDASVMCIKAKRRKLPMNSVKNKGRTKKVYDQTLNPAPIRPDNDYSSKLFYAVPETRSRARQKLKILQSINETDILDENNNVLNHCDTDVSSSPSSTTITRLVDTDEGIPSNQTDNRPGSNSEKSEFHLDTVATTTSTPDTADTDTAMDWVVVAELDTTQVSPAKLRAKTSSRLHTDTDTPQRYTRLTHRRLGQPSVAQGQVFTIIPPPF